MVRRILCMLCSLLLAGGMVGCASRTKQTATFMDVFDTVTTITVYGVDAATFATQKEELHDWLLEYHRLYDIYIDYPGLVNLKTVNDAAGGEALAVDERILALLEYGQAAFQRTDGRVNILSGSVLRLWHDCRAAALESPDKATLPDRAALQTAGQHTAIEALVIDRARGTVQITDPQARVDVGALAKGYVTEQMAEYVAEAFGWKHALLNVGGNVRTVGGKSENTPFTIGIQNPDTASAQTYLCTVEIADAAVVTSGDYQRYYTVDGQRYAHIIDMDTLYPAAYMQAVTVITPDSALADELSTALFTMPVDEAVAYVDAVEDAAAVFVLKDGSRRYSARFEEYIQ